MAEPLFLSLVAVYIDDSLATILCLAVTVAHSGNISNEPYDSLKAWIFSKGTEFCQVDDDTIQDWNIFKLEIPIGQTANLNCYITSHWHPLTTVPETHMFDLKIIVRRLNSFSDGLFSGQAVSFRRGRFVCWHDSRHDHFKMPPILDGVFRHDWS